MEDRALIRMLETLNAIGRRSRKRAAFVTAFMANPFRSYGEIGSEFSVTCGTVRYHLEQAALDHPEVRKLVESPQRREIVRKRGQKRKGKK